ncbi:MAG: iron-containing alcohol dehydrogenase [Candidatus Magnetominusculus sp. LBB02]|nr:iron-containing alcohol dehydrogenase [Candidatus Magnetominusculus sp. LBB02]
MEKAGLFNFNFRTRVGFGVGVRHDLLSILKEEGWNAIGIVVDHALAKQPLVDELLGKISAITAVCNVGCCTMAEPTYDALEQMRTIYEDQRLHAIVGIGGGSALDMAKGMAVLSRNRGTALSYRGFDKMTEPVLPVIAIPTTAGTGSEITPNASFIDAEQKRKMGINGEAVRPRYALLDPELTLSCPTGPTLSDGLDSIVHGVEAYVAKKTNVMARMFAIEGLRRQFVNLPLVMVEPDNVDFRSELQYGAFLTGIALMNSGTGPAAAMSYPLGCTTELHMVLVVAYFYLMWLRIILRVAATGMRSCLNALPIVMAQPFLVKQVKSKPLPSKIICSHCGIASEYRATSKALDSTDSLFRSS